MLTDDDLSKIKKLLGMKNKYLSPKQNVFKVVIYTSTEKLTTNWKKIEDVKPPWTEARKTIKLVVK